MFVDLRKAYDNALFIKFWHVPEGTNINVNVIGALKNYTSKK